MFDLTLICAFLVGCIVIHAAGRFAAALTSLLLGTALLLATFAAILVYHQAKVKLAANLHHYEAAAFGAVVAKQSSDGSMSNRWQIQSPESQ